MQSDHRRSMQLLRILTTAVRLNWARKQCCHFYLYMCTTETLITTHFISVASHQTHLQCSHHILDDLEDYVQTSLYFDWYPPGVSVWAQHLHRARRHHCGNTSLEYTICLLYNFKFQKWALKSDVMIMWWAKRVQTHHCPIMILRSDISQNTFLSTHLNYSISSQPLAFACTVSTVNSHF